MPTCQSGGNGHIIFGRMLSNFICYLGLGWNGSTRIDRCGNTTRTVRVLARYGPPMSGVISLLDFGSDVLSRREGSKFHSKIRPLLAFNSVVL